MAASRQIRETVFTAGSTFHIQRPRARLKKELGAVGAHLDTTTIRLVEVFSLSSPKGGEGGGEEATIIECPSPQPSPHSFLAGRGRKFWCLWKIRPRRAAALFAACVACRST